MARGGDGLWCWLATAWLGLAETPGMEPRRAHLQLPRIMDVLNPWVLNISGHPVPAFDQSHSRKSVFSCSDAISYFFICACCPIGGYH